MDRQEISRCGGIARAQSLTQEERRIIGRAAYLVGAVNTVIRRVNELTQEQIDALREAVG